MLRLRHLVRISIDVGSYARLNRAWWLLPFVVVAAVLVAVAGVAQTAVPYAVYTFF